MTGTNVKITPDKTWIPIGVAIAGLISFFWAGWSYKDILSNQETTQATLIRIEEKVNEVTRSNVNLYEIKQWIELLRAKNPTYVIPDFPR